MPTSDPTPAQLALDEFKRFSDILAVPLDGKPLLYGRRWRVPCPDDKAFADFPEPVAKHAKWKADWTACDSTAGPVLLAEQSSKASAKQAR